MLPTPTHRERRADSYIKELGLPVTILTLLHASAEITRIPGESQYRLSCSCGMNFFGSDVRRLFDSWQAAEHRGGPALQGWNVFQESDAEREGRRAARLEQLRRGQEVAMSFTPGQLRTLTERPAERKTSRMMKMYRHRWS